MNKDSVIHKLKNKSTELGINYNEILSKFFFDEFLKQIANSVYRGNFILKGGLLLTYYLGIQNRTTKDIDFLFKKCQLEEAEIKKILKEVVGDNKQTDVWFELNDTAKKIMPEDKYGGLSFHLVGHLANMKASFNVDIAVGGPIYPLTTKKYSTILGDEIELRMYPLELVLSEKLHAVLERTEKNSRSKDFYDIYTILKDKQEELNIKELKEAIAVTFGYRKTFISKNEAKDIINDINEDSLMRERWTNYQKKHQYAKGIDFSEITESINALVDMSM